MTTQPAAITPTTIATMDAKRRRDYQLNLDFYNGKQWPGQQGRKERRLTLNYAKTLIDKLASYTMTDLSFAVDPERGTNRSQERSQAAEDALRSVYEDNQLALLDLDTEIDTSILGDGAYKITWDVTDQRVRVTCPDVSGLFAWTRPDDITQITTVATQYTDPDKVTHTEVWTDHTLQLWQNNDQTLAAPNPYGFIPFVVYPNLRRPKQLWGDSDLLAIEETQKELNRELSNLSLIMELSGNPIAVLENVESSSAVEVKPGAVWEIPERAKAYLLDLLAGGGVNVHVDYVNLLYRTLHDLAETPRTAFGDNVRNLSGVALEVELQPLLHKVHRKRLIRTAAYQRRNALILRLLEQFTPVTKGLYAPYRSRIIWGPVTPKDRAATIAAERALVSAAIHSRRRAADTLGVDDPDRELQTWLDEERQIRALDPQNKPLDLQT